jgi:3-hydroxyisobutyrate dehydrogenase
MGKTITHVGPSGAGQAVKAVNQVILAGTYLGVAEGIVLAMKAGLDVAQVVDALGGGAAQSWVLANRSGRMLANDYPLGFKVALHRKDLGIALDLAREMGADLPVTELAAAFESDLIAVGSAGLSARPRDAQTGAATPPPTPTSSIGSPSLPS